uniref:Pantothenate kinase n=1 Tax=Parascaris univalens TaxID=6257 RepID=A0A915BAV9_PARUN
MLAAIYCALSPPYNHEYVPSAYLVPDIRATKMSRKKHPARLQDLIVLTRLIIFHLPDNCHYRRPAFEGSKGNILCNSVLQFA